MLIDPVEISALLGAMLPETRVTLPPLPVPVASVTRLVTKIALLVVLEPADSVMLHTIGGDDVPANGTVDRLPD